MVVLVAQEWETGDVPSRHVVARLKRELVIWIATVGRDKHPHVVPVWFWWDGESFLMYAIPGQKVRDIQANPNVALHLNSDPAGEDVVRVDGTAKIDPKHPPATKVAGYLRKYREHIEGLGMTVEEFSQQYHHAIRVQPTRFHE